MKAIQAGNDEEKILIEIVDMPEVLGASQEGLAGAFDISDKLEDVSETITSVCQSLFEKAYQALGDNKPDEFQIEFGITLAGETGVPLVTKGSAECAVKVTAKWT